MVTNPFTSAFLRGDADAARRPQGGLSYVAGPTDDALKFITIAQLLDRACTRHGAATAAIFAGVARTLTWHDLRRRADDVASGLLALGIGRGDRVGVWASNRPEWLDVQFGTARIGAILVTIDPACQAFELEQALRKVACKALILARGPAPADQVAVLRALAPEIDRAGQGFSAARLPDLRHLVMLDDQPALPGAMRFSDLTKLAGPGHRGRLKTLTAALDPDDAITIRFTGGTTGSPNAATLSHFGLVNNARHSAKGMALTARDRLCVAAPLHHWLGMTGVLGATAVGATLVFPGEPGDAAATLAAVARHGGTALLGAPATLIAMLDDPASQDTSSLRTGLMAGGPCPLETLRRVVARLHLPEITVAYGKTETGPIALQSSVTASLARRVSTVGRVHPHVEAKIVDAAGRVVPVGTPGELCIRGYAVMRGYWGDAERTAEAIDAAGWMHSGDLATIDAEGFCRIVGRVRDAKTA